MNMEKDTIVILRLQSYDGKFTKTSELYFLNEDRAISYLIINGYERDDIHGWKKSFLETARMTTAELIT